MCDNGWPEFITNEVSGGADFPGQLLPPSRILSKPRTIPWSIHMSIAATTADAASAGEEAESLKEQDATSRLEVVVAEDVLGLADIGVDEDADVPGDSPELQTRTRVRTGGAQGGARRCSERQCSGGRWRFVCVRG
jgi:hypothetical protein